MRWSAQGRGWTRPRGPKQLRTDAVVVEADAPAVVLGLDGAVGISPRRDVEREARPCDQRESQEQGRTQDSPEWCPSRHNSAVSLLQAHMASQATLLSLPIVVYFARRHPIEQVS